MSGGHSWRASRSILLLSVLLVAACSSADDVTPSSRTRAPRSTDPSGEKESPSLNPAEEPPDLRTDRFQLPMRNILCQYARDPALLICGIESGLVPEPPNEYCGAEWIGLSLEVDRLATPACTGDWELDPQPAPVLEYGKTWSVGNAKCLSESTGLSCHDASGNGFTLSRAGWSLLGKEDAATAAFGELRNLVRKEAQADLPGRIANVPRPVLRAGTGCGELQGATVTAELDDGTSAVYTACYAIASWHIGAGPLFPS